MSEWIRTSERLPEGPWPVLCHCYWPTMSMHTMAVLYMWGAGEYRRWQEMDGRAAHCLVTHWQPLPETPRDTVTSAEPVRKEV